MRHDIFGHRFKQFWIANENNGIASSKYGLTLDDNDVEIDDMFVLDE